MSEGLKDILMRLAVSPSGFTFDPQTGRSFTLNPTALAVLFGLRNGRTLSEMTAELAGKHRLLPERVEASLSNFVNQLEKQLR